MLPAIYDVAAIRQRLAQLEEERRQKVDELTSEAL